MALPLTADFEGGVNGNNILATDAGSATAWTTITNAGANNFLTYDNTHAAHGTLAAKFDNSGTPSSDIYAAWTTPFGTQTNWNGRIYLYATANPAATAYIADLTGAEGELLGITSAGKVTLLTAGITTTAAIALNQWVRIEWHLICSATVGQGEIVLYNTPDSATPTETKTSAANKNIPNSTGVRFGARHTTAFIHWKDSAVAAAAYPGPFPVNTIAPAVTGGTSLGSVLTCDGGTWNGTFTLSYQWTRDGSNIGGATSSTYVTVAGDATHAVGCNVTATGQQATNEAATSSSSNTITVTAAASSGTILPRTRDRIRVFPG